LPSRNSPDVVFEEFIRDGAPSEEAFAALQLYAGRYIERGDYESAKRIYSSALAQFPNNSADISRILSLFDENIIVMPINLGVFVNSAGSETFPAFTPRGDTIFFTGKDREDNSIGDNEDIFAATKIAGGWSRAAPMGGVFSSQTANEAINSISEDGRFMLLFTNRTDPVGNNAILIRSGSSSIIEFSKPLNGIYFDSDAVFADDIAAIVFVSDRPGAIGDYRPNGRPFRAGYLGNTDIYISVKVDGEWSEPRNLGKVINTPYAERTPFITGGGKVLIFSSEGHYGLGGLDIFVSFRLGDDWTSWTEPVNLGLGVNSPENDWGFAIAPDKETAYFSSLRAGGLGGYDIYSVSKAAFEDKIVPPPEPAPEIIESEPVIEPIVRNIEPKPDTAADHSVEPIIEFSMEDTFTVRFDVEGANISPVFYSHLDSVATILRQNPDLRLHIEGHTDSRGPANFNIELSITRARAVADYLVERGTLRRKLDIEGHGESFPIAENTTETGRALNRRVECRLFRIDD